MASMLDWVAENPDYECAGYRERGYPHLPFQTEAFDSLGRRKLTCYWCKEALIEVECWPGFIPDRHPCRCHDHCGDGA